MDNIRAAHYARLRYNPLAASLHCGRRFQDEKAILKESIALLARFGLRSYAGEPAQSLPYGLQRKLEIARALATKPRLLLLDEPAAGMNPNEMTNLMEFIRQIRRDFDLTILLIEHQMMLVMNICERLKVLDFGVTIAEGPPNTVRNHPEVLEAYLGDSDGL
jgi:branched-chain amino acid transport system ATP-binding protein